MMGYCPHVSNMFASWHRPYLALFEQILHDKAVDIANEYTVGEARNKAMSIAERVRLPYWDWAMNPPNSEEGSMPACLRRPTATVTFPNGTKGEIPNPLYRYEFHPLKYDDFAPLVSTSSLLSDLCSRPSCLMNYAWLTLLRVNSSIKTGTILGETRSMVLRPTQPAAMTSLPSALTSNNQTTETCSTSCSPSTSHSTK